MNQGWSATRTEQLLHRAQLAARLVPQRRRSRAFGDNARGDPAIERILVINLNREHRRWVRMERELARLRDASDRGLHLRARRLPAVDAQLLDDAVTHDTLVKTSYRLAEQLAIDPEPLLDVDKAGDTPIVMTHPEVAVALSHIRAWESVANSDFEFTLVVEDDVVPVFGFARALDDAWSVAHLGNRERASFDVLYLSYKAVGAAASLAEAGTGADPAARTLGAVGLRPLAGRCQATAWDAPRPPAPSTYGPTTSSKGSTCWRSAHQSCGNAATSPRRTRTPSCRS